MTETANDKLEKNRLHFTRCANRGVTPLKILHFLQNGIREITEINLEMKMKVIKNNGKHINDYNMDTQKRKCAYL